MNTTPYTAAVSSRIKSRFILGQAGRYSPEDLVRAKVFNHQPLVGGIHKRKSLISNLIIHSTETGSPCDGPCVIKSWNRGGASHPGTQYVVDRDGKIYQTVDPAYATAHVNISRTRKGVTNQNSIGIEIVRTGSQQYTATQMRSLVRLVAYIKDRYPITNIYGHGQIQPSNRTDPVAFDWGNFKTDLRYLDASETAYASDAKNKQS
ncbi:MAG: peptidoglycan recognition protein family protein [Cyanobacteria bacterium]|nr:peptidoglycan recognition protein family protein [Cyanobacteriota bacterium]